MRRKIIDEYIYELYIFRICMDATFFSISRFLTIFSLKTRQTEVKLVAIKSDYFRRKPIPPFVFRKHSLSESV